MSQFNTEYIPTSNEDLFLVYFEPVNGLVKQTIRAKGNGQIDADAVDEIASAIMFRFIESDLLLRFDPKRVVSFSSFLYNITINGINDHWRYQSRIGASIDVVKSVEYSDETEDVRDRKYVAAVEATQETSASWHETIASMKTFAVRCSRLNRHKRDRSLRTVLAMSSDGDSLESMSGAIGTSVATVRNYIRYIAHGALAETSGVAAAYASESTCRPDARREMSAKDLASLVRAHPEKPLVFADADGAVTYPMFVAYRRGWHFVTMGDTARIDLRSLTGETRGFKLLRPDETVIKIRHVDVTSDVTLVSEAVPTAS